ACCDRRGERSPACRDAARLRSGFHQGRRRVRHGTAEAGRRDGAMTVTHPAKRQGLRGEGVGSLWSFLTWPIHTLAAVSAALVAVGFAAVVIAVFYRYLLGAPLNGVDELTGYLVVAITSCGLGSALLLDQHIGVDILTASAGRGAKRGLEIWASLCVLVC